MSAAIHPTTVAAEDRTAARPWLTLVTVALGLMMVMLDTSVVSVANATIGSDLDASLADLQWVANGYLLALATGLVLGGKLGDLYGRRRLFVAGVVLFALASLGCGLSSSIGVLIAFRVAQGLGGALMMPQTLATLRASFPPHMLQFAVGIWAGTSALAIASGPIVGGLLVEHVSWQSIFFINVIIGAVAVLGALRFITESRDHRTQGLDLLGAALLAGALFALIWAFIKTESHGWISAYTLGILAASAVLFALLVLHLARAERPLIPLSLFRTRSLDAGVVVVAAVAFALFGVLFYVTLYLQRVQGYSPVEAGVRMLPLTGLVGLSAPVGGALGGRIPLRAQLFVGLLLVAAGMLGLRGLDPDSSFGALWPWFVATGIGIGLTMSGASQAIVGSAPVERAGIAAGLQQTSIQIGASLGTALLGSIVTARVADVLPGHLLAHGVPAGAADKVATAKSAIAQGVVPVPSGAPSGLTRAVTAASQQAVTDGMHTAFLVAACVAAAGALIGLAFVRSPAVTR